MLVKTHLLYVGLSLEQEQLLRQESKAVSITKVLHRGALACLRLSGRFSDLVSSRRNIQEGIFTKSF